MTDNKVVIKKGEKPTAWSEEDERNMQDIDSVLFMTTLPEDTRVKLRNFLKSLKDRYTWKPSEEQMDALESATENCAYSEYQDCLRELIGQLKKLTKKKL